MPNDVGGAKKKARRRHKKRGSFKGKLLKGMTSRLPIQLLGDLSFQEGLEEIMRGHAGVYALYRGKRLYYVGLATNLYSRLRWHTKNKHKGKWDQFAIFRVRRVYHLKDMETLLLQVALPPGNSFSGRLHRDADLNRVLKGVLRENRLRLNQLRKALR